MSLKIILQKDEEPSWRTILRKNFRRLEDLTSFLQLTNDQCAQLIQKPNFSLNVPLRLAEKMQKGTIYDPLFRQFVPLKEELIIHPLFTTNPVGDIDACKESKLLHKYKGRVLLLVSSACAMHCRYCFRQHYPYENERKGYAQELEQIKNDKTIHEVILSGGDPLSVSNEVLGALLKEIRAISHIKRVRFHTRFPIGIPERIDSGLVNLFQDYPSQIYFVLHINHPNELDEHLFNHIKKIQNAGAIVLNSAVLLKDVNDSVFVLQTLCEQLADRGVLPYYLSQLDRVAGSTHFEVLQEKGLELITQIAKSLPGYAVPKYIREIAGEPFKTVL